MQYALWLVLLLLLLAIVYLGLPTAWNFAKSYLELKKKLPPNKVMLTFDDGPDARYTDKLLDVLAANNIKATFFLVANKIPQNLAVIKRMQKEGHTIALHSLNHKSQWLMGYKHTKQNFTESLAILAENGLKVEYYRPCWGLTNLFTVIFARRYGFKLIYWHVMAGDWSKRSNDNSIINKLNRRCKESRTVICLHDSGEGSGGAPGAPLNTICALARLLPVWQQKGIEFVTPDQLNYS